MRHDVNHSSWPHLFHLLAVIENFIFYSPLLSLPTTAASTSPGKFASAGAVAELTAAPAFHRRVSSGDGGSTGGNFSSSTSSSLFARPSSDRRFKKVGLHMKLDAGLCEDVALAEKVIDLLQPFNFADIDPNSDIYSNTDRERIKKLRKRGLAELSFFRTVVAYLQQSSSGNTLNNAKKRGSTEEDPTSTSDPHPSKLPQLLEKRREQRKLSGTGLSGMLTRSKRLKSMEQKLVSGFVQLSERQTYETSALEQIDEKACNDEPSITRKRSNADTLLTGSEDRCNHWRTDLSPMHNPNFAAELNQRLQAEMDKARATKPKVKPARGASMDEQDGALKLKPKPRDPRSNPLPLQRYPTAPESAFKTVLSSSEGESSCSSNSTSTGPSPSESSWPSPSVSPLKDRSLTPPRRPPQLATSASSPSNHSKPDSYSSTPPFDDRPVAASMLLSMLRQPPKLLDEVRHPTIKLRPVTSAEAEAVLELARKKAATRPRPPPIPRGMTTTCSHCNASIIIYSAIRQFNQSFCSSCFIAQYGSCTSCLRRIQTGERYVRIIGVDELEASSTEPVLDDSHLIQLQVASEDVEQLILASAASDNDFIALFYHASCLACVECTVEKVTKDSLIKQQYFQHQGRIYCGRHYAQLQGSKTCVQCGQTILTSSVAAHGCYWHSSCFKCAGGCGRILTPDEARLKPSVLLDGNGQGVDDTAQHSVPLMVRSNTFAYCSTCYVSPSICVGCKSAIHDDNGGGVIVQAVDATNDSIKRFYHRACYRCEDCEVDVDHCADGDGDYDTHAGTTNRQRLFATEQEDGLFCRKHFAEKYFPCCGVCSHPIESRVPGDSINLSGVDYHASCMRCFVCHCQLDTEMDVYTAQATDVCNGDDNNEDASNQQQILLCANHRLFDSMSST